MSGFVNLSALDLDSDSNNDTHNSYSESECDETDNSDELNEKCRIKSLQLELEILRLTIDVEDKKSRNKVHRSSKISRSSTRNPKVSENNNKRKRKYSVGSSKYVHGEQNTRNRSSVIDNVQLEPKSILNPSKRTKPLNLTTPEKIILRIILVPLG